MLLRFLPFMIGRKTRKFKPVHSSATDDIYRIMDICQYDIGKEGIQVDRQGIIGNAGFRV